MAGTNPQGNHPGIGAGDGGNAAVTLHPDVHNQIHEAAMAEGATPQQAATLPPVVIDAITQMIPLMVQMLMNLLNKHKTPPTP
jgi:hypothetical protein